MKDLIAIFVLLAIMTGSAMWVRNDTDKLARDRFKLNVATAYREVIKNENK